MDTQIAAALRKIIPKCSSFFIFRPYVMRKMHNRFAINSSNKLLKICKKIAYLPLQSKTGKGGVEMGAHERRMAIWRSLCCRRYETVAHLAAEHNVSVRTIYNDVQSLSLSYPTHGVCKHTLMLVRFQRTSIASGSLCTGLRILCNHRPILPMQVIPAERNISMIAAEMKNEVATVRIHDEYYVKEPHGYVAQLNQIVSNSYKRRATARLASMNCRSDSVDSLP